MHKFLLVLFFTITITNIIKAQPAPFQIVIEPVHFPDIDGLQSYAVSQADGKWLIVGGRKDGLHMRQPFGAFRPAGKNKMLTVIDPVNLKKWEAPLSTLSAELQDQLSATNAQFHQEGNRLYVIGGYGHSDILNKFITHDKLTAIDVAETIKAIINNEILSTFFRQISDTAFAVTGGHLKKLNETYYLIGGQKFMGRYNPMGPDHGPGFFQQYSNQIRKFQINDDGENISIQNYETVTDAAAFHRRDYNVVPQILPNQSEALSVFSGVFQPSVNIPFLNSVTINSKTYTIDNSFAQYYNHYHSAVLPLYSDKQNEMHNIFFGGIAQYYDSAGVLVQNDEVPFVKTIARVTRDKYGQMAEYKLPVEMPALLGAGSEFIKSPSVPKYPNGIIKLDELNSDTNFVGHIYGGISSSLPNVFFINTGEESKASNRLFKVYVIKNSTSAQDKINSQSINGLQLQVFPDADEDEFLINFMLSKNTDVEIIIKDAKGKILKKQTLKGLNAGKNAVTKSVKSMIPGDSFWVTLKTAEAESTQKIIIEE